MPELIGKPKHMDEIDYMLNELNSDDNQRINIIKSQIKSRFKNLENSIKFQQIKYNILYKEFITMIDEYDIDNKHYEKIFNRLVNELAEKDDYITR